MLDGLSASMNTRLNGSGIGWSVRTESIAGPTMTETLLARPDALCYLAAAKGEGGRCGRVNTRT